jgi:hypothetical protein
LHCGQTFYGLFGASGIMHIVGGACGTVFGFAVRRK